MFRGGVLARRRAGQKLVPSPGGQISRMGACHPDDLPEGLPHSRPWAEPRRVGCGVRRGLPTSVRVVGLRQVDGMTLGTQPTCVRTERRSHG
jgi:hypothetical protein